MAINLIEKNDDFDEISSSQHEIQLDFLLFLLSVGLNVGGKIS